MAELLTAAAAAPLAAGTIAPDRCERAPDGSLLELTDVPILPLAAPRGSKVLRLAQIAAMSPGERGTLLGLCYDLFVEHWREITFGPCIEGAVFELTLAAPPQAFSLLDGYLTVVFSETAHFHLCIEAHRGLGRARTAPALARHRRCARVAFVRTTQGTCMPQSWSLRFWNGAGEPMMTVFLPNAHLDDRLRRLQAPDPSRLALWNLLRARYLGETVSQPFES